VTSEEKWADRRKERESTNRRTKERTPQKKRSKAKKKEECCLNFLLLYELFISWELKENATWLAS
jgi:hypothetical protein